MPQVINQATGDNWVIYHGDSAEVLRGLPDRSVHHAIFSPPFSSLYTYSASDRDLGNVRNRGEFFQHFAYVTRELLRVMMPGRIVAMHTQEIQEYGTSASNGRGRYDFPGDCIRHMEEMGFRYRGRTTIWKNPQTAAVRNHPQELMFVTLHRDASKLCMVQADYLLMFMAPGENTIPIVDPIDEETWIQWAAPVWMDIREMDILPDAGSRDNDDERHLCPLQLPVVERSVRLYSNPGEVVLSPFAGIGSEGVGALRCGRKFVGVELKESYFRVAERFLNDVTRTQNQPTLFDLISTT